MKHKSFARVLGIDLHPRHFGYVILESPDRLLDWGVRLKLREGLRSRWHSGTAHLLPDDNPRERQRWLAGQLPSSAANAAVVRLLGTQLLTVRIDLDA
ncbi:MAG: hypothetical protein DMG85_21530 [Acidobacteria bacterium]|nr:MAG: hypothetical protein DMG85_21530 [Acidobacteriota bacterium]